MSRVVIAGVGMTPFGRFPLQGIRSLAVNALDLALDDAGIPAEDVSKVYFGNAAAGIVTQQEMIRGQVALRHHVLGRTSLINVENACASSGSALSLAYAAVAGGQEEVVVVIGVEKLNHEDKSRPFNALRGATDIEEIGESVPGEMATNSILMDFYAGVARTYLERYEASPEDFARVAVKNRRNAAHNPLAHFRKPQTLEDVMNSRMIVPPLTLSMCAPTTDGAAVLVVCSEQYARKHACKAVRVQACEVAAAPGGGRSPVAPASAAVYEAAGMGAKDLDLIELHDAAAPAELLQYAEIGLCGEGEGHHLVRAGTTDINGKIPVNTSGGLLSRGHPLGATGCAQIVELCLQLRGEAGERQIADARNALAVNGGGWLDGAYALAVATIVSKID